MIANKKELECGRKEWIDALRSIAMIFVVYGHQVSDWKEFFVFTSPIKICLFFAITGYVLNTSRDGKFFFSKLFHQLIFPWFVLSFVQIVLLMPIKGGFQFFKSEILDLIMGKTKWYIPCCVIAEAIWYGVNRITQKKLRLIIPISFALFVLGEFVLYKQNILDFWMINRAFTVQPFLLIGAIYRKVENAIDRKSKWLVIFGLIVYISLGVLTIYLYPGQCIDVHLVRYYNHLICFIMIFIGVFVMFVLFDKCISKYPKWLLIIGRHTLVIYLSHTFAIMVMYKLCEVLGLEEGRAMNLVITVCVCCICCLLSIGINRIAPWIIGRKKN